MGFEISSITTYPIKGLSGQNHEKVQLAKNGLLAGDREFALSSGTPQSETAATDSWLKKAHFLQTMTTEALGALDLSYDASSGRIVLRDRLGDVLLFDGNITIKDECDALCRAIARFLDRGNEVPRLFRLSDGAGMTDTKTPYLAFGNHASIDDFSAKVGIDSDARRYRLNVMMTGDAPFAENNLIGKDVQIGTAILRFVEPVGRCAAIEVDPKTAQRRKGLVQDLHNAYGAADMGVFASVISQGQFGLGDKVVIL